MMIDKEKLKEILKEMSRPRKHEVGFVEARRTVNDGLVILGMTATDILGFAKEANETKARRSRGSQAWFKKMYEDGWRYAGNFEYEGLLHAGFIIMEREVPNRRLEQLIKSLSEGEKDPFLIDTPIVGIDRGPALPKIEERMQTTKESLKKMGYKEEEITFTEINPDAMQPLPEVFKVKPVDERLKEAMSEKSSPYVPLEVIKKIKEPKEGFEPDIADFILDAQKGMKSLEQQFFDDTGKNAIWRGNETKGFKNWKENRD